MKRKNSKLKQMQQLKRKEKPRPLSWLLKEPPQPLKVRLRSRPPKIELPKSDKKWRLLVQKEKESIMLRGPSLLKCRGRMRRIKEPRHKLKQLRKRSKKPRLFLKRKMRRPRELEKRPLPTSRNPKLRPKREKLRPKHSARRTKRPQQKPRLKERQPLPLLEPPPRKLTSFNLLPGRREMNKWLLSIKEDGGEKSCL